MQQALISRCGLRRSPFARLLLPSDDTAGAIELDLEDDVDESIDSQRSDGEEDGDGEEGSAAEADCSAGSRWVCSSNHTSKHYGALLQPNCERSCRSKSCSSRRNGLLHFCCTVSGVVTMSGKEFDRKREWLGMRKRIVLHCSSTLWWGARKRRWKQRIRKRTREELCSLFEHKIDCKAHPHHGVASVSWFSFWFHTGDHEVWWCFSRHDMTANGKSFIIDQADLPNVSSPDQLSSTSAQILRF